ncbi:hypothetical protein PENTCL1PPCAC_23017 [Pristionchus entomophagus]|uniref:beta-N-acetylhexosaminidase n=1 Tax=Pristionchus entomophagus TaxID=358040 RepID=A0AAV5U2M3_9BILA|nr:hypothetical protein PENTCL1PPCAC_23017 [Pristionchus entomophagus]
MSSSPSATRPSIALLILIGLFILLTWAFVQSQILSSYGGITKSLPTEKNKTVVESATVSSIDDNRVTNVANEYKEYIHSTVSNHWNSSRSIAIPDGHPRGKKPFKQRWVHLDLKGAPPRVSYLSRLFPLLPRLGVTGLVIEWEDSFPYEGRLSILKAPHAYTKGDVEEILRLANVSSLEVVPLIQSFGHLEFVLKHDRFAHLRERVTEESSICPSRDESVPLIRDMIKQMRKFHPHSTRIHIGADEAYYVGEDVHCRIRLNNELNQNVERLKLDHIAKVARSALEEGFTEVLAWNDMFDRASVELMREVQLGALITPVVWGYAEDVTREDYFPKGLFTRLSHVFDKIWFASAYKGANGQGNVFISIDRYLANQRSYARLYRDFEKDLYPRLEGIILTGWSRFSHRQPLCELLPSSLPSIVLNLIYLDDVTATAKLISTKTKDFLACPSNPSPGLYEAKEYNQSIFYPPKEQIFTQCVFPSSDLFTAIQELGFLNWKSSKVTTEIEKERLKFNTNVLQMQSKIRPLLSSVLFDDAVDEFLQSKVNSLILSKPTPPPPESIPLQEPL